MPRNPFFTRLTAAVRAATKLKPAKAYGPLYEAFVLLAAAGDVPRADRVLRLMHAPPVVKAKCNWYATPAIDVFCFVAGLPDYTEGLPITCTPVMPELAAVTGLPEAPAGPGAGPSKGAPRETRIPGWELSFVCV